MRIESFWAKGFRSLREVRLEGLGPFNVLYGPNGGGKSNILAAIEVWSQMISRAPGVLDGASDLLQYDQIRDCFRERDFALGSPRREAVLGGTLVEQNEPERITVEIVLTEFPQAKPPTLQVAGTGVPIGPHKVDWRRVFSLVPADRMPRTEVAGERPPEGEDPLSWYFRNGRIKEALFAAQNTSSPSVARALERFRQLMAGPPLHRPPFRSVEDPHTGARDLHERLPAPFEDHEVSLDLAGLGIAQIYWILGQAMLSGARAVGIEEPEAHLHAPTSGLHLRELLARLVNEKHIDQLFIATHSSLFDLDATGFWDVRLENGETKVVKKPLDDIDQHLYEPGPTLRAFEELLKLADPDRVMARRAGGVPVTAREMLSLLRTADPIAIEYLQDLHRAAVDVVGLRARRKSPS